MITYMGMQSQPQYADVADTYKSLTDDDLVAVAETTFEQYDAREAVDTRNAQHDQ